MLETCKSFAELARKKSRMSLHAPGAFFVGSMFAGAYVGIALILALTCAAGLPVGVRPLVTGSVFGIGLILVLMAGAEMFTGHIMYETFGIAKRTISLVDVLRLFAIVWIGNLAGSALLAFLFAKTGGGVIFSTGTFLHDFVAKKESSSFIVLVSKAILCNWLVCLAIWLAARLKSEVAKMLGMAWCLLAFVACGFEHSVADMTAVCLGLFAPTPTGSVLDAANVLGAVSLGNMIGGALFVAGAYMWFARAELADGPAEIKETNALPKSGFAAASTH